MKRFFSQSGQSLIELLLAIGMLSIILPALSLMIIGTRNGRPQQNQRLQALSLLKEAAEAVRVMRDSGWTAVATDGTYHPTISGSTWTLAANSETIGDFTRQIDISDVSRDASGAIVTSGGTADPSTKKILITVSWTNPYTSSITQTLYVTRHEIIGYTETTQAQFDLGTKTNTFTTNTSGGEVTLGAGGGGGDWCIPSKSITTFDLPKNGVANAISAIEGTVFAGTGDNASGVSFQKISLTANQDPPVAAGGATFDGYKTNGVFGEANYAYLTTDNNTKEVVMMSLTQYSDPPTNSKYKEIGSIDLPGNGNGNSIYVLSDKAYVTGGSKLYIYNLSADRTSATLQNTGGLTLSGTGNKVIVESLSGSTYAFVLTNATTNQLQIVNVTNPVSPSIVGQVTLGSSQSGIDLFENPTGTRAYVVTSYSVGKRNLFIVNTTTKNSPVEVCPSAGCGVANGYNTGGMNPKGLTVVTGNRLIVVGTGGSVQYQVIDISSEIAPSACGTGLTYATGVNGVASVLQSNGYAYSYIITGDANAELKVILGGAGGQYVSSGTYTSAPYQNSMSTAFNAFKATVSNPANTTIKMQVAVANAVGGSCTAASYTYLGPGGDPAQYFTVGSDPTTIEGAIPLITSGNYVNPGQCFRYRYTFQTTDSTATPILYDMTVNYSP